MTLDWYSTTSGELDAQEQYTTGGTTVPINGWSQTDSGLVTVNANNNFQFGDEATVTGLPAAYDGTFQVITATSTTFTYADAAYPATGQGTLSGSDVGSAYVPIWQNINNPVQAVSNDFYGATAGQGVTSVSSVSTSNVATINADNNYTTGETATWPISHRAQFDGTFITASSCFITCCIDWKRCAPHHSNPELNFAAKCRYQWTADPADDRRFKHPWRIQQSEFRRAAGECV